MEIQKQQSKRTDKKKAEFFTNNLIRKDTRGTLQQIRIEHIRLKRR